MIHRIFVLGLALLLMSGVAAISAEAPKPLRALLITGGCCHNYPLQSAQLSNAVAKLAPAVWTVVNEGGNGTRAQIPLYANPGWAKGYDVVVHIVCFADTTDTNYIRSITQSHRS